MNLNTFIEEQVAEYKERFWSDESELRSWILKQSTQRPEEEDFIRSALQSLRDAMLADVRDVYKSECTCEDDGLHDDPRRMCDCNEGAKNDLRDAVIKKWTE